VDALKGVDAEFPAGAVTAVVGPSGSGKSSLLRLLAALDRPSGGSIFVGDRDLSKLAPARLKTLRRRVIGYVFQRPSDNFVSYLTVDEHLRLAALAARGFARDPDELLERLGLAHRRNHLPRELSGGEQQRAAVAIALVSGPRVVVADEPTAELDTASAEGLLSTIHGLASGGVAFVIATHDRNVIRIADEIVELEHGVVRGSAQALLHAPAGSAARRSTESDPLLIGDRLTKTYARGGERLRALDSVTLSLRPGQLIGLVGRSGSGKTTLLNVLGGWERPDSGRLVWLKNGARPDVAALGWHELAVVPQRFGLEEDLTVRENVEYPARLAGLLPSLSAHVDELLAGFGLEELADRMPLETSIGQQQRTALARALVLSPQLVLADEPTGHQDAGWTQEVLGLLRQASSGGTCCLVATHDADIGAHLDVTYAMTNGRLTAAS
jgi:ABC-type lipoprotein export system ATPase subunit